MWVVTFSSRYEKVTPGRLYSYITQEGPADNDVYRIINDCGDRIAIMNPWNGMNCAFTGECWLVIEGATHG